MSIGNEDGRASPPRFSLSVVAQTGELTVLTIG
jgi:hypothetical protein